MVLRIIDYRGGDHGEANKNHFARAKRDSGIENVDIISQPNRVGLFNFLNSLAYDDHLILNFISHGNLQGIGKKIPRTDDLEMESFIYYTDLVERLHAVANRCQSLLVNLGTVCNSNSIMTHIHTDRFSILTTPMGNVSDAMTPMIFNREYDQNLADLNQVVAPVGYNFFL